MSAVPSIHDTVQAALSGCAGVFSSRDAEMAVVQVLEEREDTIAGRLYDLLTEANVDRLEQAALTSLIHEAFGHPDDSKPDLAALRDEANTKVSAAQAALADLKSALDVLIETEADTLRT